MQTICSKKFTLLSQFLYLSSFFSIFWIIYAMWTASFWKVFRSRSKRSHRKGGELWDRHWEQHSFLFFFIRNDWNKNMLCGGHGPEPGPPSTPSSLAQQALISPLSDRLWTDICRHTGVTTRRQAIRKVYRCVGEKRRTNSKLGSNQRAGSGIKLRPLGPSEAAADFSFWFEARSLQFEVLWTRFNKLTSVPARLQVT